MPKKSKAPESEYAFEWDEEKNLVNIAKHGFDFADAEELFRGPLLVNPDLREERGGALDRNWGNSWSGGGGGFYWPRRSKNSNHFIEKGNTS